MIGLSLKLLAKNLDKKIVHKILRKPFLGPWMSPLEIIIVENILKGLKPKKCLEWGSGYSTLMFPKLLDRDSQWISVEHDFDWAKKIKSINKRSNVNIFYVAPNNLSWSDLYKDGAVSDLKDYIEFPCQFMPFDFILIDGRARKDCLIKALDLLKKGGIAVLHDAERVYYREPLGLYKYGFSFSDYTHGKVKLWIGSNEVDIEKGFNVSQYLKLENIRKAFKKLGEITKVI